MKFTVFLGMIVSASLAATVRADDADTAFFEGKVRPILVQRCYSCHSADAKKVRGGLLLDSKDGWEKGGDTGPSIVPGNVEESLLAQAIRYDRDELRMPPKGKLPEAEIAVLNDWIKRGAIDPRKGRVAAKAGKRVIDIDRARTHWAFQPLRASTAPQTDSTWTKSPIDAYILARLLEKKLTPNPPANRRALIRRVSFDLVGLPPSPEEVEAFVADRDPNAFEKVVDRLIADPGYGERWARHWLDLARFAESHGYEHDYDRPTAYHYRDFVVEAFNRDLPYDVFVKWQLAGDELAPDDNLALAATGFLAAGVHSTQITANQVEKERYDELDDIVQTIGTSLLGLTIGCARCHDHKYDPIPTNDYYRILSTFATTVRGEVDLIPDRAGYAKALAKYEREHAPYVDAITRFDRESTPARLQAWEKALAARAKTKPEWVVLEPIKSESKAGATFKTLEDGSIRVSGENADFDTYTISLACELPEITAIKIEAMKDEGLVQGGPGRAPNGNFDLTDLSLTIGPRYGIGASTKPSLINPKATFEQKGLPISAAIDGDKKTGWAVDPQFGRDHAAVFELVADARTDSGATLTFTVDFQGNARHNIGRLRFSATSAPRPVGLKDDGIPQEIAKVLAIDTEKRTNEQKEKILVWYKTIDPERRALERARDDHAKTAPKSNGVKALICSEGIDPLRLHTQGADFFEKTYFLRRGDPNQKAGEATQGFLQVLMTSPEKEKHWKLTPPSGARVSFRRASLANWMTDVDQGAGALLARVIVNRLWKQHFGRGLVATSSDFGFQSEPPTHPDLLDRLALELVRNGWRLKPIQRLIVTSATYQESSFDDPAKAKIDPDDHLLWRHRRVRLEAESIRDSLLAVSGKLDRRMFGPGTLDEHQTRRSLYFTVKRSKLIPFMTQFDAPDALQGLSERSSTTVAPQALLLLNNPIVREWAEAFAQRIVPKEGRTLESSVREAYRLAFAREPSAEESADDLAFLKRQLESYRRDGKNDGFAQALTDFCQSIFCSNEFLTID